MRSRSLAPGGENFELFLARAHELVEAGYRKLRPSRYNTAGETSITGELALGIEQVLRDEQAPRWTHFWSVMENAPENEEDKPLSRRRKGKHRKLPDLKLRLRGLREVLYLRFEAKLLTGENTYEDLIGLGPKHHGLGRFLSRRYGRADEAGALLGYVQLGSEQAHSNRVKAAFETGAKRYRIVPGGEWNAVAWEKGPRYCFRTVHQRHRTGGMIIILHTYLLFR